MADARKATRQVCDVDIRILSTMKPFLFIDFANTNTVGVSGDSVYAMKKGARSVAFQNPMEGNLTIEAQVVPFKFYALMSDGTIKTDAAVAKHATITATEAGKLTLPGTVKAGTVFVYKKDEYGDEDIKGTLSGSVFTATNAADIKSGTAYEVGYIQTKSEGVQRIEIATDKIPQDYFITMQTIEKNEEGLMTPFVITAYKASVERNFELSFSSEGDPASISMSFSLLEDKEGRLIDMTELTDESK